MKFTAAPPLMETATAEQQEKARMVVCSEARDAVEAALFLDMLGLSTDV